MTHLVLFYRLRIGKHMSKEIGVSSQEANEKL